MIKWLLIIAFLMIPASSYAAYKEEGIASVYCNKRTASGERMDCRHLTAAHRFLPFGHRVVVINPKNHKLAIVRINDRGPFKKHRKLDLSPAAGLALGLKGLGRVIMLGIGF